MKKKCFPPNIFSLGQNSKQYSAILILIWAPDKKKKSEYDQEIPQLLTADQPTALQRRATDMRKTKYRNQLSLSQQDGCLKLERTID